MAPWYNVIVLTYIREQLLEWSGGGVVLQVATRILLT